MKYYISDEKTKKLINELGEEYKDLLIEAALRNSRQIDMDKLESSNLTKLDEKVKIILRRKKIGFNYVDFFFSIAATGAMIALLGLLFPYISKYIFPANIEISPNTGSMLAITGVTLSIVAFIISFIISLRKDHHSYSTYIIVNKWSEIEALIREISPNSDEISLKKMINNLAEEKIVNPDDVKKIEGLLRVRNAFTHNKIVLSRYGERQLIYEANEIIEKLKKTKKNMDD